MGTLSHENMGSSTAAYAARAGLTCYILAPVDIIPTRLAFLSVYGARVIQVKGDYDAIYDLSLKISTRDGIFLAISGFPKSQNDVNSDR